MSWHHYVDGEDFASSSAMLTINSDATQACVNLPIPDDQIGMEGDEVFEVVLETPEGVPSTSPEPSMVIIVDDDGMPYLSESLLNP
jgi:hypothetical protein